MKSDSTLDDIWAILEPVKLARRELADDFRTLHNLNPYLARALRRKEKPC